MTSLHVICGFAPTPQSKILAASVCARLMYVCCRFVIVNWLDFQASAVRFLPNTLSVFVKTKNKLKCCDALGKFNDPFAVLLSTSNLAQLRVTVIEINKIFRITFQFLRFFVETVKHLARHFVGCSSIIISTAKETIDAHPDDFMTFVHFRSVQTRYIFMFCNS